MGVTGEHNHDVCRVDECVCSEEGCGGLDDVYDTKGFLVFDGDDPAKQSDDAGGIEIFQRAGTAPLPEFTDGDVDTGYPVHVTAVDGVPGDLAYGDHVHGFGRRPIPVYPCRVASGARARRGDRAADLA